jgi:hypothetical protein
MEGNNNGNTNDNSQQPQGGIPAAPAPVANQGLVARVRGDGLKRFGSAALQVTGVVVRTVAYAAIAGAVAGFVLKQTSGMKIVVEGMDAPQ